MEGRSARDPGRTGSLTRRDGFSVTGHLIHQGSSGGRSSRPLRGRAGHCPVHRRFYKPVRRHSALDLISRPAPRPEPDCGALDGDVHPLDQRPRRCAPARPGTYESGERESPEPDPDHSPEEWRRNRMAVPCALDVPWRSVDGLAGLESSVVFENATEIPLGVGRVGVHTKSTSDLA